MCLGCWFDVYILIFFSWFTDNQVVWLQRLSSKVNYEVLEKLFEDPVCYLFLFSFSFFSIIFFLLINSLSLHLTLNTETRTLLEAILCILLFQKKGSSFRDSIKSSFVWLITCHLSGFFLWLPSSQSFQKGETNHPRAQGWQLLGGWLFVELFSPWIIYGGCRESWWMHCHVWYM